MSDSQISIDRLLDTLKECEFRILAGPTEGPEAQMRYFMDRRNQELLYVIAGSLVSIAQDIRDLNNKN